MRCISLLVFCSSFVAICVAWQNNYDQPLHFECGDQNYVSGVTSRHDNRREDRQWEFSCTHVPASTRLGECTWYDGLNDYDELLAFRCPGQQVITGMKSVHNNRYEDRIFGFRCCRLMTMSANNCRITNFLNQYDGWMSYFVPSNCAFVGFHSEHNNRREDRRWKAEICDLQY